MKPRRLLFLTKDIRASRGGAQSSAVAFCSALQARGYTVDVVTQAADGTYSFNVVVGKQHMDELIWHGAYDLVIDWNFIHDASQIYRLGDGTLRQCLQNRRFGSRTIYGDISVQLSRVRHRRALVRQEQILRSPHKHFLANSAYGARMAINAGAAEKNVSAVYNGVDVQRYSPSTMREHSAGVREMLQVDDSHCVFLFAAHNLRLKNLGLLRQVFDQLTSELPNIRLVVVGKRPPPFERKYLIYYGPTDTFEKVLAGADALLHPSLFDPFGNVVLEAMSCGLPVVCSEYTGIGEQFEHGFHGSVVSVTDKPLEGWRHIVRELATRESLRQFYGLNARAFALQFAMQRQATHMEMYLQKVYEWLQRDAKNESLSAVA